jgi:hypothetical protein
LADIIDRRGRVSIVREALLGSSDQTLAGFFRICL